MIPANADDAIADVGEISMTNPAAVAMAFFIAGTREEGPDVGTLRTLVTPESLPAWGDFSILPEWIGHLSIGTRGTRAQTDSRSMPWSPRGRFTPSTDPEKASSDSTCWCRGQRGLIQEPSGAGSHPATCSQRSQSAGISSSRSGPRHPHEQIARKASEPFARSSAQVQGS
jgi:hypothetical protein